MNLNQIPEEVKSVARRIVQRGGRVFLVGGAVIDVILEQVPKDWDLEVFGLSYHDLIASLQI